MPKTKTATRSTPKKRFKFRASNAAIVRSQASEVMLSGPAGTGKTMAALYKLHRAAIKYPGMRAAIVRKTRESLTQSALVTYENKVLDRPWYNRIALGCQRRVRQSYTYPNGSELVVGGLDKPSKLMSTEFDLIFVNQAEETSEGDWESLLSRLRNGRIPYQQIYGDCNPDAPMHWLRVRANRGDCEMLESGHKDNPELWDSTLEQWTPNGVQYIAKLDRLTGARKERLRYGRWVQAEGVVYESFNRSIHVIDRFPIPPEWRRIRSVDFGFVNPLCCQWWAIDHDGRMYLYREIYMTGRTVAVHTKKILQLTADEKIESTDADHDAEDRATMAAAGLHTVPAIKPISTGIQAVEEQLAVAGDGKPRLMIFRDALVERDPALDDAKLPCCTAEEFDGYVWPKGHDGRPLKEIPVDVNNHGLDALRYAVMRANRVKHPMFYKL